MSVRRSAWFASRTARWRVFWRWLHVGRLSPPLAVEAALAAWPAMLWAGPASTLPPELRPTARRRLWARAVLQAAAAEQREWERRMLERWTLYGPK